MFAPKFLNTLEEVNEYLKSDIVDGFSFHAFFKEENKNHVPQPGCSKAILIKAIKKDNPDINITHIISLGSQDYVYANFVKELVTWL